MNSETENPKDVLPNSKKIETWEGAARLGAGLGVLMFIVFFALVVSGIGQKPSIIPPIGVFLLASCVAFLLGLLRKATKAIEDLQGRVSELEKHSP